MQQRQLHTYKLEFYNPLKHYLLQAGSLEGCTSQLRTEQRICTILWCLPSHARSLNTFLPSPSHLQTRDNNQCKMQTFDIEIGHRCRLLPKASCFGIRAVACVITIACGLLSSWSTPFTPLPVSLLQQCKIASALEYTHAIFPSLHISLTSLSTAQLSLSHLSPMHNSLSLISLHK